MPEIVRKHLAPCDIGTPHKPLSIFQTVLRSSGFPFLETNTEPLVIFCSLEYFRSILHSSFGRITTRILPFRLICAFCAFKLSTVIYLPIPLSLLSISSASRNTTAHCPCFLQRLKAVRTLPLSVPYPYWRISAFGFSDFSL